MDDVGDPAGNSRNVAGRERKYRFIVCSFVAVTWVPFDFQTKPDEA